MCDDIKLGKIQNNHIGLRVSNIPKKHIRHTNEDC